MRRFLAICLVAVPVLLIAAVEGDGPAWSEATTVFQQIHARLTQLGYLLLGILIVVPVAAIYLAKVIGDVATERDASQTRTEGKEDG